MNAHNTATNYFYSNSLMVEYGYSLSELDDLLPYEKDIYLNLLIRRLEDKREAQAKAMGV